VAWGRHLRSVVDCQSAVDRLTEVRERDRRRPCAASTYEMYEKNKKYSGGGVLWLWPVARVREFYSIRFALLVNEMEEVYEQRER
jgi:hypothetical protein